jgi:hypothetical protein
MAHRMSSVLHIHGHVKHALHAWQTTASGRGLAPGAFELRSPVFQLGIGRGKPTSYRWAALRIQHSRLASPISLAKHTASAVRSRETLGGHTILVMLGIP